MANNKTIFQRLNSIFDASGVDLTKVNNELKNKSNTYSINNDILIKTPSKEEYEIAKLQAQQSKFLSGLWKKSENELLQHSLHYETTRIGSYADFESMEFYPEIAAALDIFMEECLEGSTIIPLLNGEELTIREIYENNLKDFWVYSVDLNTNKIKPSKVEKAILKGYKKIFKVTLDDDTELLCTDNHKWLRYDNTWVETKDLITGESLKAISGGFDNKDYENLNDLKSTIGNHRVVKVEYYGESEVFDLVNSSVSENFAVKCNNGFIISHNCTTLNSKGRVLNVYSESKRIQAILEDLFFNRLDIHLSLPMWVRNICKYGDNFLLLNIDDSNGIVGCRQLPNFEIERKEGDVIYNQYSGEYKINNENENAKVKFFWRGRDFEFNSWQVAHFRLLGDDRRLPYGSSLLEKARSIWKRLQLAEDAMLVYRITRAPERRVYKIFVGNLDDKDVPAYVDEIANRFKRRPVIDPQTGQMDLRYNQLANDQDYFIPVRDENAATPIDTLPGASNIDQIGDIQYLQRKLFTALRVPKTFLGFEEAVGDGKNLALQDIRFSRTINRVQQAVISELNKIAIIHLYMLGFEDELNNFNLSLNNPSTQAEMLKIEQLQAKMSVYKDAISEAGNGFMGMSMTRARRDILGWTDEEIRQDLLEQRLEKAAAAEIENTSSVIKTTGIFNEVDSIYGDISAVGKQSTEEGEGGDTSGGGGSFGGGGGSFGGGLETPEIGGDEGGLETPEAGAEEGGLESPEAGAEGETPEAGAPEEGNAGELSEGVNKTKGIIKESVNTNKKIIKERQDYVNKLLDVIDTNDKSLINEKVVVYDKNLKINEHINSIIKDIDDMLKD